MKASIIASAIGPKISTAGINRRSHRKTFGDRSTIQCTATIRRLSGPAVLSGAWWSFFYPGEENLGARPGDALPGNKSLARMTVILAVDDSEDDLFLLRRALEKSELPFLLRTVNHGDAAIEYLTGEGRYADRAQYPMPGIMFLDLKMPGRNGFEFLQWYQSRPPVDNLEIVVLSGSDEERDLRRTQSLGVTTYLVKPPTAQALRRVLGK